MLIYWIIFLIPASMALFTARTRQYEFMPWLLISSLLVLLIGFRSEVGGDWSGYLRHYERVIGIPLTQALSYGDSGHQFLNWQVAKWNWGVYGTNFIYSIMFSVGLVQFSRSQVYPWLAMTVAAPYLVTVVAMGYSRQGVAIGLFLMAITYLQKGKFKTYVAFILIAALFHKTAILLLPLGMFHYGKGLFFRLLMLIPIVYGAWDLLLAEQQEQLWYNYVEVQMQSNGAKIRVLMNLIPSVLLLIYRKEWQRSFDDYIFWFWIAIGSIISMGLVSSASTAVDRVALYFIPIQLVVFARLPFLARKQVAPNNTIVMIVLGYTVVLFVWLNYASHAKYWLPYKNLLY